MENLDILVNKQNKLDRTCVPQNLVEIPNPYYQSIIENYPLRALKFVYEAFELMAIAANQAGFQIFIDSGYRSYEYQEEVLSFYVKQMGKEAYTKVALPGTSEHQTGLAIDCSTIIDGKYVDELTDDLPVTKWLHENCCHFGFVLRYPKGKEEITGYNYEPWHLRFVGVELATKLTDSNMTLEEYHLMMSKYSNAKL